jgi:hypothetical protein
MSTNYQQSEEQDRLEMEEYASQILLRKKEKTPSCFSFLTGMTLKPG